MTKTQKRKVGYFTHHKTVKQNPAMADWIARGVY